MNNNIEVSIFCIAHNHEKYIKEAIEGFVRQKTSFKFEIIIHDDASTDRTTEIIKKYKLKYPNLIKTIYQSENQFSKKVDIFYKYMFPKAKGKYIAICEGDDYWCDDNKLQIQYDALEANPNCASCVHIVDCCKENGDYIGYYKPSKKYNLLDSKIINQEQFSTMLFEIGKLTCPFQTSSFFFRKTIFEKYYGNKWSAWPMLDLELLRSFLIAGECYYIHKPMSVYRINSISSLSIMSINHPEKIFYSKDKNAKEDLEFDKYTNYSYHNKIIKEICGYFVYTQKTYFDLNAKMMKEYNISHFDVIKNVKFKASIKYLVNLIAIKVKKALKEIKL